MPAERRKAMGLGFASRIVLAGAMLVVLAACSMAELDAHGAKVAVIDKPYEGCEYVTTGYGRSYFEKNAMNNLRNFMGESGATHMVVTTETQVGGPVLPAGGNSLTIHGVGYRCPPKGVRSDGRKK
jgi:hypothetical protein